MTDLEELEGLHDEVAKVESLLLSVVDVVAHVGVLSDEDVEHRQDLPVVRHECLADNAGP